MVDCIEFTLACLAHGLAIVKKRTMGKETDMGNYHQVLILVALLLSTGCAEKEDTAGIIGSGENGQVILQAAAPQNKSASKYLAYVHNVSLELDQERVAPAHKLVSDACRQDDQYQCVVLEASINTGYSARATLKLRLLPEGVNYFLNLLDEQGEVISRNSTAEDLGDRIVDTTKRIEMLESYRKKLIALEARSDHTIESLLKVSEELSRVQNDIEYAKGRHAKLLQRVKSDILTIEMRSPYTQENVSPWARIGDAFGDFGNDLSFAVASVITALAYVLPWGIFLIGLLLLLRLVWRLIRGKSVNAQKQES